MVRDAVRQFVDNEIRPHREELEHGDLPPYDLLRKLYKTFGMDQMAADGFDSRIAAEEARRTTRRASARRAAGAGGGGGGFTHAADHRALQVLAGHGHRDGRVGRAHRRPRSWRRARSRRRSAGRATSLTMEKIGAWAITEPNSGSDAFGSMAVDRAARRRRVRAQRLEDVHHQRSVRRHDRVHLQARRGQPARRAQGRCSSCSTRACPASSSRSRCARWACTRRRPACCSSTTCASARDRLLGESEEAFGGSGGPRGVARRRS